jgi:hypothetical protein
VTVTLHESWKNKYVSHPPSSCFSSITLPYRSKHFPGSSFSLAVADEQKNDKINPIFSKREQIIKTSQFFFPPFVKVAKKRTQVFLSLGFVFAWRFNSVFWRVNTFDALSAWPFKKARRAYIYAG